jgi:basic membrane lipoprotein Med (substrate-binding protein (PBP1-ABC) superfamily)
MSNHFNYNSKILVMPRHNTGRHLVATSSVVFRASVIKWNDPTYRIHFIAKQVKDKDVDVVTPLSPPHAYRTPEPEILSAQNCWH